MGFPARAPIAQVAGETSSAAALQELAGEMQRARDEGRMIQALPIEAVKSGYLTRDRIAVKGEELEALKSSIRERGQQTPIEVVADETGGFGLISGWRRLTALQQLHQETGEDRFATVLAVLRKPETASAAYVAMVEENEIRQGLSYYERARIAAKAVEQGVFESEKQSLNMLFSTASRSKRSKIKSFLVLYHAADDLLKFPETISERLGLALARELDMSSTHRDLLRDGLQSTPRDTSEAEAQLLQDVLVTFTETGPKSTDLETIQSPNPTPEPTKAKAEAERVTEHATGRVSLREDLELRFDINRLELRGRGVTPQLRAALMAWLQRQ